jgi:hypothetical protein
MLDSRRLNDDLFCFQGMFVFKGPVGQRVRESSTYEGLASAIFSGIIGQETRQTLLGLGYAKFSVPIGRTDLLLTLFF